MIVKKKMSIEYSEQDLEDIAGEIKTQQKEIGIVRSITQADKSVTYSSTKEQHENIAMMGVYSDVLNQRSAGLLVSNSRDRSFGFNQGFNPITPQLLFKMEYDYKTSFSE